MFGSVSQFFTAMRRLTASVNQTADLVDAANETLAVRLAFDDQEAPVLIEGPMKDKPNRRRAS